MVEFLEKMVTSFEMILEGYPIEKIKTIGDAFMCTSGLLSESPRPVKSLVQAGLKMIHAAKEQTNFDIRVGIHVGPVVAGKLGHRQFTFDLWGGTVNIASRMESNGFSNVTELRKDDQGVWRGKAMKDGKAVTVSLDFQGNVTAQ